MAAEISPGTGNDGEELPGSSPSSSPDPALIPDSAAGRAASGPAGRAAGWFAEGGPAGAVAPGAKLAAAVALVAGPAGGDGAGLAGLGDEDLLEVIGATHRLISWITWVQLLGLREVAARRPGTDGHGCPRDAAEEVSWVTGESWHRAGEQMMRAATCAARLPQSLAALGQGLISGYKLAIIEAQTAVLSDADAARADVILAAAAQVKAPGALRDFARRQVARLDPESTRRRKDSARRDGYLSFWQEDSGNAGMSAREMPAADALIAWQRVEQRALDLRAAGVEGKAGELQVRAVLDLLTGRADPPAPARSVPQYAPGEADGNGERVPQYAPDSPDEDDEGSAYPGTRRGGTRWAAQPVLIVPWNPSLGIPAAAATVPGFGDVDTADTMDLLAAAAADRATRLCVTVTGADGSTLAHGCAAGPRTLGQVIGTGTSTDLITRLGITLTPVSTGTCDHRAIEPGYVPSRKLRHLITARNTTCAAPGCGKPAARCDLDHTIPFEKGGLTCECGLAPLCRHHHQVKQAEGWVVQQPELGVLQWTSPSGLTRTTRPTSYQAA
jgi:Domain of unknown function (DUF222)